ncbi:MAG: TIGR02466 family protein [Pseudomonadota bacterium]
MPLEYEVKPLFAAPYMRASIAGSVTPDEVAYIRGLKMVTNRSNLISENLYIFREPELAGLSAVVQEVLDTYAREVMGIPQTLYVTQSWSLINEPGTGMHTHAHSNSIVSGSLYYDELPEPGGKMVFDRQVMYQQLQLNPVPDKQNIYNTPVHALQPRAGEMILFPSQYNHMVEPNGSEQRRHSIAFNCFVKGDLGSYRDVSELKLG